MSGTRRGAAAKRDFGREARLRKRRTLIVDRMLCGINIELPTGGPGPAAHECRPGALNKKDTALIVAVIVILGIWLWLWLNPQAVTPSAVTLHLN
jgi:hypothetical protein